MELHLPENPIEKDGHEFLADWWIRGHWRKIGKKPSWPLAKKAVAIGKVTHENILNYKPLQY